MSWREMQSVFATIYVDEIAAVQFRGGEALMRERLGALNPETRSALRKALEEVAA